PGAVRAPPPRSHDAASAGEGGAVLRHPGAWFPHRLGREACPSRTSTPTTPATMVSSDRQSGQPAPDTARRLDLCIRAPPAAAAQARRALRRLGLSLPLADDAQPGTPAL